MSELFLQFGEARMKVEGSDCLVEQEREVFLKRLDRQTDKAAGALAGLMEAMKRTVPESGDVLAGVNVGTCPATYNMRAYKQLYITPEMLRTNKAAGKLDELLHPFDEIDVPVDTGGTVTAVCAYVTPTTARFVFKDCWAEAVMNDEATNKTGYFKSKGRAHVLVNILPHIAPEWRAIFKPRQMVEKIGGERVEYADLMWLPSATDVFGSPDWKWWPDEEDSFQLPIFQKERDRVKECGDEGTYPYWLRSVGATDSNYFCIVSTSGGASNYSAYYSIGCAPGFDI